MTMQPIDDDREPTVRELLDKYDEIKALIVEYRKETADFNTKFQSYREAADRVANLAFNVVNAAAAVAILSPAVKAFADYFISTKH